MIDLQYQERWAEAKTRSQAVGVFLVEIPSLVSESVTSIDEYANDTDSLRSAKNVRDTETSCSGECC